MYKNSIYRKQDTVSIIDRISRRFITFFDKKTYSGRTKLLSEKVREKIKDKSDYVKVKVKKVFYVKLMDMISKVLMKMFDKIKLNRLPLFNPEQRWRIAFNTLIVLFNCFYIYIVSLKIAFNSDEISHLQQILQQVAQVVWLADMVIQMNTAMYHNNEFTEDRKIIMKTFLKEYFFFEVLPIIFENLHSNNLQLNIVFHLPLLLKIKGIMIMLENLEFYILQMLENHSIFFLVKLILQMILFAHILACSRKTVIAYESTFEYEQLIWSQQSMNYHNNEQSINYLQNMFWAFSLMLNVSHPTPSTKLELVFTSCCMLVSCIAFGYLLTSISAILSQLNKGSEDYKRDLNILNQYMKRKKIEIGLKRRANISLKKYYDQLVRIKSTEERATLDKVDNRMFRELQISSNQRVVKYCPILEHLFTENTLEQICVNFEEVFYSPHETIVDNDEKQSNDCFLYIVIDGKICENYDRVQVANNENKNQMMLQKSALTRIGGGYFRSKQNYSNQYSGLVVEKGEFFGLIGFMLGRQLITKAQSLEYTTLLRISRSEVEKIIQNNTRDRELFMEMRDRLLYNNDISNLLIECVFCKSQSHLSQDCNLLHFDKSNPYIHWRNNYSQPQFRDQETQRQKTKYINALIKNKQILEHIEELRSNYGIESTRKLDESDQLIENSFNMSDEVIQKELEITEEDDDSSQYQENDQEQEQISEDDTKSINSLKDVGAAQKKKKKKQNKEKNDKIRQQKTMKDQIAKNKDSEDQNQHKSKYKSNSFIELKCDDQLQQKQSSLQPFTNDLSKFSQLSHLKFNDMTVSGQQHLQHNQLFQITSRTKSLLAPEREDEILTYDLVEDDLMSRKNIQKRSSQIFSKGYGVYFHDGNLDKLPSLNSQVNIQRVPTLEAILKKQATMHSPSQIPLQKLYNNPPEKSNTVSTPKQRKKKNSFSNQFSNQLSNQHSINLNSSFNPTLSIRETRSFNGSRKDNQTQSKMKTKMTSKSSSMNQSYVKFENELKQFVTNSIQNFDEEEAFSQNLTEKQDNRPLQRQFNQDKKFYWYFDKMQNFQFYFWTYNSASQIKKYNFYISSRKIKLKSKVFLSPKKEKMNNSK